MLPLSLTLLLAVLPPTGGAAAAMREAATVERAQTGPSAGRSGPAVLAQDSGASANAQSSGAQGSKKKKVIRLDAITVEGRIQKPQAFYILQRSNLNFDELNRTESFLPKVEESVEKDPF